MTGTIRKLSPSIAWRIYNVPGEPVNHDKLVSL